MAKVKVSGEWPGAITLRKGWARANSRPWNDTVRMAHLRMLRGTAPFIGECVDALRELGAPGVLSPPLPAAAQRVWKEANFVPHAELLLLRLDLDRIPPPSQLVVAGGTSDLREALRIDAAAFDEFWRFDHSAMLEALDSTRTSVIHVVRNAAGGLAGFAITGVGIALAYLQRVAVDPASQGRGVGRSLVRTSARWAQRKGAKALMLNTQADNGPALHLYASEGFRTLEEPLTVLRDTA